MSQLPSGERWGTPWTSPRHIAGLRQQPCALTCTWPSLTGTRLNLNGIVVMESPTNKTNEMKDTSSLTGSVPPSNSPEGGVGQRTARFLDQGDNIKEGKASFTRLVM